MSPFPHTFELAFVPNDKKTNEEHIINDEVKELSGAEHAKRVQEIHVRLKFWDDQIESAILGKLGDNYAIVKEKDHVKNIGSETFTTFIVEKSSPLISWGLCRKLEEKDFTKKEGPDRFVYSKTLSRRGAPFSLKNSSD